MQNIGWSCPVFSLFPSPVLFLITIADTPLETSRETEGKGVDPTPQFFISVFKSKSKKNVFFWGGNFFRGDFSWQGGDIILPGPKRSFTVKENHIGSTVARSFATEKKLTSLYDILNVHIFNVFLIFGLKFYHHFYFLLIFYIL